jgi:PAS domain-containing protein
MSQYVGKLPNLPIAAFGRLAQSTAGLKPWETRRVRRKGFEAGFNGPRILVPRGVETSRMRLRAVYSEDALTFQHIIQAITVPPGKEDQGKLLTALLNSRVAIWYAFHGTASFGADRPEVQQAELLRLPFPQPNDFSDKKKSANAAKQLVALVNESLLGASAPFALDHDDQSVLTKIDRLAYEFFGLSEQEIILIEDAVEKIIPAVQPHQGNYPELWKVPTEDDRRAYAHTLISSVREWFRADGSISAHLEASSPDLGILRLSLDGDSNEYTESKSNSVTEALAGIAEHIHQPLGGNFHLFPDLRIFAGKNLYLIKPMQLRFWLRVTALADADAIAMDLQDAVAMERRRSRS